MSQNTAPPFRTTRGKLPARFRSTENIPSPVQYSTPRDDNISSSLKKLRTTQASALTRLINKGTHAISDGRSKTYLGECIENIELSLATLEQTNRLYLDTLTDVGQIAQATEWFNSREQTAQWKIQEIKKHLLSATHLFTTTLPSEYGEEGSINSESSKQPSVSSEHQKSIIPPSESSKQPSTTCEHRNLVLEAQQAKLELLQIQRRAKRNEEEVNIKYQQELSKVKLESQEEIEHAQLKATTLQEFATGSVNRDLKFSGSVLQGLSVINKSEAVADWIQTSRELKGNHGHQTNQGQVSQGQGQVDQGQVSQGQGHHTNQRSQVSQGQVDQGQVSQGQGHAYGRQANRELQRDHPEDHQANQTNQYRYTSTKPTSINIHSSLDPTTPHFVPKAMDAWIDDLIPGHETVLLYSEPTAEFQLTSVLVKLESERDLPQMQLPVFSGSPLEWPKFIERFYAQVHCKWGINDTRRMDILQSHLTKEAKSLVEGIGYSGKCYAQVLQELKKNFGHRSSVARAYLDQVVTGHVVRARNPTALRQFFVSVRDCLVTLSQLNYTSDLSSSDVLLRASKRIPFDRVNHWNKYVVRISKTREPTLYDLHNWLEECVAMDFNPYAVHSDSPRNKDSHTHKKPTATVLNTTTKSTTKSEPEKPSGQANAPKKEAYVCPLCSEGHFLYRCPQFSNKPTHERRKLVESQKLCYNCLKPKHGVKKCTSSVRCRESDCKQKHHTLLHDETKAKTCMNIVSKTVSDGIGDKPAHFQLVRVFVTGKNGRTVPTVALLDSASEITLIQETLARDLGLKGPKQQLHIKTMNSDSSDISEQVSFKVKASDQLDSDYLCVEKAWTVKTEFHTPPQHISSDWIHLGDLGFSDIEGHEVQLLIGVNVPHAHLQIDQRLGKKGQPIAVKTVLGWSLIGGSEMCDSEEKQASINFTIASDIQLSQQMEKFWSTESFGVAHKDKTMRSTDDARGQTILDNSTILVDGHYEVGMLWKDPNSELPNNWSVAERRLQLLIRRLNRNHDMRSLYTDTLNGYIEKGHARMLHQSEAETLSPRTWYIPHHGVVNCNKPGKVRVVFDAAATYRGTSLNDNLITGPDLLNSLFGVLQRFRLYEYAIAADVEGMFHQIRVPEADSDSLRFLWKSDISTPGPPDVYKMTVHIFGAKDSPTCANYALRRTATDNSDNFSKLAVETVCRDFYVDDLLKSVESVEIATHLSGELVSILKLGGFRLHKWMSNSVEILKTFDKTELAVQDMDLAAREFPTQRTLGLTWNPGRDIFVFSSKPKDTPLTKRGVISAVSSIFDPCGFLAPFIIRAKFLTQDLWKSGLDWDDSLSATQIKEWKTWLDDLDGLSSFRLDRHHKGFSSEASHIQLHTFCDASERGFGAVAYLRYCANQEQSQHECSFLAAKTHVAPVKTMSIPRLELQGAVLAVRLGNTLLKELDFSFTSVVYWTDSTTVLRYLQSTSTRFKPFVANRISEILDSSEVKQWRYVPSSQNPADCSTRGLKAASLMNSGWFQGPEYLYDSEDEWPDFPEMTKPIDDDPEIKADKSVCMTITLPSETCSATFKIKTSNIINPNQFSSWRKLVRHTAWVLRAIKNFASVISRFRVHQRQNSDLTAVEYEEATLCLIQQAQEDAFTDDIVCIGKDQPLSAKSRLASLCPVYDGRCLRVSGRLRKAVIPVEAKHQLILPDDHAVTRLLCDDIHARNAHCGREHLIAEIRSKFWPIRVRNVAKRVIFDCRKCRRGRVKPVVVKMADLPSCRLSVQSGAFFETGVDYFGPMSVKLRRCTVKRWGCLFTCLGTRAVHLELADSLETDDFLLCLRNFIGRRGHPKRMYSDNGTNFRGADSELRQCLREFNEHKISELLTPQGIEWHFIPPQAPHFGGAWERLVRSVKTALRATLSNILVSESVLRTALIEVEAVLNSRPLTHNSADPDDFTALTPNHFLIGRADNQFLPVYVADKEIDSRRRWRQVQVVANHVCQRWTREYLPTLTARSRWIQSGQPVHVGDLVLLADVNLPRGCWELARVLELFPGDDGLTRTVKVKTAKSEYLRPVTKICILEENVI